MKISKMLNKISLLMGVIALTTSCESGDNTFPDFDYTSVYFANQYPIRTVELGEDLYVDLTNDNNHMVSINAATGGAYTNSKNIIINYSVDPSLCQGLSFKGGSAIEVMPSSYYSLESENIVIPFGQIQGGVKVHLNDAFFNDPKSINCTYVIPVRINSVEGADSILSEKNFVLYAVKFVNPWHAKYLRRGVDNITTTSGTVRNIRHQQYVEKDEIQSVTTLGYKQAGMVIGIKDGAGKSHECNLILTFDDNGACTVSTNTNGFTASGKGSFVIKGEKKSMGGIDRNALYLDYSIASESLGMTVSTKDTMVVQTRNVKPEYFSVE